MNELRAEVQAKKKIRDHTIVQAFCDRRVLLLIAVWVLALAGSLGNIYWIPTSLSAFRNSLTGL